MKIKPRNRLPARAFLPKQNLQPYFRFADGLFVYSLTPFQRRLLKVPKDNPGVAIVIAE